MTAFMDNTEQRTAKTAVRQQGLEGSNPAVDRLKGEDGASEG